MGEILIQSPIYIGTDTTESTPDILIEIASPLYLGVLEHEDIIMPESVTFEALNNNGDVGHRADQVAVGNHDHEIGNQALLFENQLI